MDSVLVRLLVAAVIGIPVGLVIPLGGEDGILIRVLACYVCAGLAFVIPLVHTILTSDATQTKAMVSGSDGSRRLSDLVVITVGLASMLGVVVLLIATQQRGGSRVAAGVIGLMTVAVGWLAVQSIYTLRYARIYYASDNSPIDFNDKDDPALSDFAYFAYNLGMTYAVSDTNASGRAVRKVILAHSMLSYIYGTVVIATTVSLVGGLTS